MKKWLGLMSLLVASMTDLFVQAEIPSHIYLDKCLPQVKGGPIDVDFPLQYSGNISSPAFSLGFTIKATFNTSVVKVTQGHLAYLGGFGSITYQDEEYVISRLDVISPSVHMVRCG